jgi:signal transduction histidine kinase
MKIRTSVLGLCLGSSALLIVLTLAGIRQMQKLTRMVASGTQQEEQDHLQSLIDLEQRSIDAFVFDLTYWDDLVAFTHNRNQKFADDNIGNSLETYGLDAAYIFSPEFEIIYSANAGETEKRPIFEHRTHPVAAAFANQRFIHFFLQSPIGLLEAFGASIHPTNDKERATDPQGYLVVLRYWNDKQIDKLSQLSQSTITVDSLFKEMKGADQSGETCHITIPLNNQNNQPTAILHARKDMDYLRSHATLLKNYLAFFMSIHVALAVMLMTGLYVWVLRPLKHVSQSLKEGSTAPIRNLTHYEEINEIEQQITFRLQQTEELKKAQQDAESANLAKTQFLRNISHELKTPLNGIFGAEQLMETTELDDTQLEFIHIIKECGHGLNALIDQLLTLSGLECGMLNLNQHPLDIRDILAGANRFGADLADQGPISFSMSYCDEDMPHVLIGDALRVQEILTHLISNAFKFTHEGNVSLTVTKQDELAKEIIYRFSVSDTGIGVDQTDLDQLTKIFTQADASNTRNYAGLGIGLSIVRMLVSKMDGTIYVTKGADKGSVFSVEIPFRKIT